MNILKPIIGFIVHKKVLSTIVGICVAGGVTSAAVINNMGFKPAPAVSSSSAAHTPSMKTQAQLLNEVRALSDSASSEASSVSSSAPESVSSTSSTSSTSTPASSTPSSMPASSTAPNNSTDTSAARQDALDAENAQNARNVAAINAQYDPQIASTQAETDAFLAENARDTTSEIQQLKDRMDETQKQLDDYMHEKDLHDYSDPTAHLKDEVYEGAKAAYYGNKPTLEKLAQDYQKLQFDRDNLQNLQSAKNSAMVNESNRHYSALQNIYALYK